MIEHSNRDEQNPKQQMNTSVQVSQNGRKRNLGTTSSFSFPNQQRQQQQSRIPSYNDPSSSSALLWVDKYKPQRVDQLVVAPKKIAEIRQFLLSFSTSTLGPKLLILTGGPGIGTSFTIHLYLSIFDFRLNIIR